MLTVTSSSDAVGAIAEWLGLRSPVERAFLVEARPDLFQTMGWEGAARRALGGWDLSVGHVLTQPQWQVLLAAEALACAGRDVEDSSADPVTEIAELVTALCGDRAAERAVAESIVESLLARLVLLPAGPGGVRVTPYYAYRRSQVEPLPDGFGSPPPMETTTAAAGVVAGQGQLAAVEALSVADAMLEELDSTPVRLRRDDGLMVREMRRLSQAIGADPQLVRLLLDLLTSAGLAGMFAGTPADASQRLEPTSQWPAWRDRSAPERLAALIGAWMILPGVPLAPGPGADFLLAIHPYGTGMCVAARRQAVLDVFAALPDGVGAPHLLAAADDEDVDYPLWEAAEWLRPQCVPAHCGPALAATAREAELLGLVAQGALTPVGRAVLTRLPHTPCPLLVPASVVTALTATLTAVLPASVDRVFVLADMTIIVPGPACPPLARLLHLIADRESREAASTWRISPASLQRALAAGATADHLRERLQAVCAAPLPQPVTYLFTDAARTGCPPLTPVPAPRPAALPPRLAPPGENSANAWSLSQQGGGSKRIAIAVGGRIRSMADHYLTWRKADEAAWIRAQLDLHAGHTAVHTAAGAVPARAADAVQSAIRAKARALRPTRWPTLDDIADTAIRKRLLAPDLKNFFGEPRRGEDDALIHQPGRRPGTPGPGHAHSAARLAITLPANLIETGRWTAARYSATPHAQLAALREDRAAHAIRTRKAVREHEVLTWPELIRQALDQHFQTITETYGCDWTTWTDPADTTAQ